MFLAWTALPAQHDEYPVSVFRYAIYAWMRSWRWPNTAACRYRQPASRNQKALREALAVHFCAEYGIEPSAALIAMSRQSRAAMRHAYRVPAARFDPALPNVSQFDVRTNQGPIAYSASPVARTSGLASIRIRRRWLTCIWMLTAEPETSPAMYRCRESRRFPL